jgi:hypothetical protein
MALFTLGTRYQLPRLHHTHDMHIKHEALR